MIRHTITKFQNKYIKEKVTEIAGETFESTVTTGNFNPLSQKLIE